MTNKEKVQKQIAEAAVERVSTAVDSLYDNKAFVEFATKAEIARLNLAKLQKAEQDCAAIVAAMPIYNNKTRENRKWLPTNIFGLGMEVQALLRIATGIQYSAADHKAAMLATLGIDSVVIDMIAESMGSNTYFSTNYNTIVEGKPANIDILVPALQLLASKLGTTVDTTALNETNLRNRAEIARIKAEKDQAEYEATQLLSEGKVVI